MNFSIEKKENIGCSPLVFLTQSREQRFNSIRYSSLLVILSKIGQYIEPKLIISEVRAADTSSS